MDSDTDDNNEEANETIKTNRTNEPPIEIKNGDRAINLIVQSENMKIPIILSMNIKFEILRMVIANKYGSAPVLEFDGEALEDSTPQNHDMDEGDIIELYFNDPVV